MSWPPTYDGGAPRTTPRLNEAGPVESSQLQIVTFASKGQGLRLPLADGSPSPGTELARLRVSGEAVKVIDCPMGWPGKLVLGDIEFSIWPGLVIPTRYKSLTLKGHPPSGTVASGAIAYADSPIVLAVGQRAESYRRPGWRLHWWNRETLNIGGVIQIAPGNYSGFTEKICVPGYDWISGWYFHTGGAGNIRIAPVLRPTNPFPGTFGGTMGDVLPPANSADVYLAAGVTNIAHPIAYYARRWGAVGNAGGRYRSFAPPVSGDHVPSMPISFDSTYVQWGVYNSAASVDGIPPNGHLFAAGYYLTE